MCATASLLMTGQWEAEAAILSDIILFNLWFK